MQEWAIDDAWMALLWLGIVAFVLWASWPWARYRIRRGMAKRLERRKPLPVDTSVRTADNVGDTVDNLTGAGYTHQFHTAGGLLVDEQRRSYDPRKVVVDDIYRFEGDTDPAEEVAVFALRDPNRGIRGTYVVNYGPVVGAEDAEVVLKLERIRDSRRPVVKLVSGKGAAPGSTREHQSKPL